MSVKRRRLIAYWRQRPQVSQARIAVCSSPWHRDFGKRCYATRKIKFVVTRAGDLLVAPHTIDGVGEIAHSVISGGDGVLTAGEAEIAGANGMYFGVEIVNHSGHFQPSAASLEIARDLFLGIGVSFP